MNDHFKNWEHFVDLVLPLQLHKQNVDTGLNNTHNFISFA